MCGFFSPSALNDHPNLEAHQLFTESKLPSLIMKEVTFCGKDNHEKHY